MFEEMNSRRRQNLDSIIAKLSKEERSRNGLNNKGRILLVSEKRNACLSLPSSDEEGEGTADQDLHQCGHCKLMFNNLTKYFTHKVQKICWIAKNDVEEEIDWSLERNDTSSPEENPKGEIDEERENREPDEDLKRLHQDLPNRKHRNVHIRRSISPVNEADSGKTTFNGVFNRGEEEVNENEQQDGLIKSKETIPTTTRHLNKTGPVAIETDEIPNTKETVSQSQSPYGRHSEKSQSENTTQSESLYNGILERIRSVRPYGSLNYSNVNHNNKNDQVNPTLPQVMSTRGSPRRFCTDVARPYERPSPNNASHPYDKPSPNNGLYPVDRKYFKTRPYSDGRSYPIDRLCRTSYNRSDEEENARDHPSSYEAETSSTWTLNYVERTNKAERTRIPNSLQEVELTRTFNSSQEVGNESVNLATPEVYTTINSVDNDSNRSLYSLPKLEFASNNIKIEPDSTPTRPVCHAGGEGNNASSQLIPPPELVRIESIGNEQSNIGNPPPPLEYMASKDKTTNKEGEPDVGCPHPVNPANENVIPENMNLDESLDEEINPDGTKFMELSSPGKESNSPPGSIHEQEMDDCPQSSIHGNEMDDYMKGDSIAESADMQLLPPHQRLSELDVEQLITVPIPEGSADPAWKNAKQVYSCPLCAKVFPFKSKLQRHVLVHTRIKPYKCTVCGRGFTQQIDLQRHLTRHTGEKPFKCHLCTAQFIRADNLKKHCKDAHYVVIDEPIRKRRRRATGSDTVLPSLEVAIALAFSETERNGGRVLGRAVTKTNPRNPVASTSSKLDDQFNHNPPIPRVDIPPFRDGHPPGMYPQENIRYPMPGDMKDDYPGKRNGQFPPRYEGNNPYGIDRRKMVGYPTRRSPNYYQNRSPPRRYLPRPPYDRDTHTQELYAQRVRERKQGDPRLQAEHPSPEKRQQMGYLPLSEDPRDPYYMRRRPVDEEMMLTSKDMEFQRRYRDTGAEQLARLRSRGSTGDLRRYNESARYSVFANPRNGKENGEIAGIRERDEHVDRDARNMYMQGNPSPPELQKHASITSYSKTDKHASPYSQADSNKDAFNRNTGFRDYRSIVSNRSPDQCSSQQDPRDKLSLQGLSNRGHLGSSSPIGLRIGSEYKTNYEFDKHVIQCTTSADPGEFVSMATGKPNDSQFREITYVEDEEKRPAKETPEFMKSVELTISEDKHYADGEEISIVTPSDELSNICDQT